MDIHFIYGTALVFAVNIILHCHYSEAILTNESLRTSKLDKETARISIWDNGTSRTSKWDNERGRISKLDNETARTSKLDSGTDRISKWEYETARTSKWDNGTAKTTKRDNGKVGTLKLAHLTTRTLKWDHGTASLVHRLSPANANLSLIQPSDVLEILPRVQSDLVDPRIHILFDNQHQDVVDEVKETLQSLFRGLVLYKYDGMKATLVTLSRLAAIQGSSFILVLSTFSNVIAIFRMIWRERIESYLAHWLLMTSERNALSTIVSGLEGIVQEGTRVTLFFKEHPKEFSLFSSRADENGIVKLSPTGKWYSDKNSVRKTRDQFKTLIYPNNDVIYKNMRGRELKVGANDYEGFFKIGTTKGVRGEGGVEEDIGRPPLLGIDGAIVYTLSVALNFTYKIIRPADGLWGNPHPDGTVTGVVGLSARREVSFSICAIAITELRDSVVDFTYPYFVGPIALFSRAPRQKNKVLAVLSPFDTQVWLSLFAMVFVMGPLVSVQWRASDYLLKEESNPGFLPLAFNTFRNLVVQGNRIQMNHWSLRIIFISWYLFCLIVSSLYSGMLTAVLAIPAYEKPIDSLLDLPRAVEDGYSVGLLKDTADEMLFREATSGIYRQTWLLFDHEDPTVSFVPKSETGIQRVLDSKYVWIAFKISNELMVSRIGRRKFHIGKETFSPLICAIACPPGVPYKGTFDSTLLRMIEGGLVSKWIANEFTEASLGSLGNQIEDSAETYAITLIHLQAAFFIIVIGFSVAAVVLVLEQVMPKLS